MKKRSAALLAALSLMPVLIRPACAVQRLPEPTATKTAPAAVPETVPKTTLETAPVTAPETTPETVPATAPETTPETVPATAPETTPEAIPATVLEATSKAVPETVPETTPEEEQPSEFPDFPQYFQNDYPDTIYGTGTVATSGCGITALAMVASYMTDHAYTPAELARYFGDTADNNIARMEYGCDALELAWHKSKDWNETYGALEDGKVAIVLMSHKSLFAGSQHFLVLAGLTPEGDIFVRDPERRNYDNWKLKRGYSEGFHPGDLLYGYSSAWIFDKDAMPEEPFLYYEPEPVRGDPRYPEIQLTDGEIDLLARMVWTEARGESYEGQQAVAEVVLNRMASSEFPNTLKGVIFAQGQFRSAELLDQARPYQAQYQAVENALLGPYVLPKTVVHFASYPVNDNVWDTIGGHIFCHSASYEDCG